MPAGVCYIGLPMCGVGVGVGGVGVVVCTLSKKRISERIDLRLCMRGPWTLAPDEFVSQPDWTKGRGT